MSKARNRETVSKNKECSKIKNTENCAKKRKIEKTA